jgi:hypothetical protein
MVLDPSNLQPMYREKPRPPPSRGFFLAKDGLISRSTGMCGSDAWSRMMCMDAHMTREGMMPVATGLPWPRYLMISDDPLIFIISPISVILVTYL